MSHKSIATVCVIAALAGFIPAGKSYAAEFKDVTASTQYRTAIQALKDKGVLAGYSDGTFKAGNRINRAEFLKIVVSSLGVRLEPVSEPCFADAKRGAWYLEYVCYAKQENIVSGYPDGTFKPDQAISFIEASKILSLAYKQKPQEAGGEWYQQYVMALESSKAIPPTIDSLTRQITRAEMAEMMWRISEKKTDQPTKGYLNIKYPAAKLNFASDNVQVASSCADLQALRQEGTQSGGGTYYGKGVLMERGAMGIAAPMAANMAGDSAQKTDYSQTNVQVEGVDEADIVKTDGKNLYFLSNQKVYIVRANPTQDMRQLAVLHWDVAMGMPEPAPQFSPQELYIEGNRMIVMGTTWKQIIYGDVPRVMGGADKMMAPSIWPPYYNTTRTEARIYNISDPSKPALIRTVAVDGNSISTRMIGSKLYIVTQQGMNWGYPMPLLKTTEMDSVPKYLDSKRGAEASLVRCSDVVILPHIQRPAYISVSVIPTDNANAEVKSTVVIGDGQNVYSSLENLYVAATEWRYYWDARNSQSSEQTNVFRFAITGDGVEFKAKGSVPGHLLNQFSMDEHETTFRVATTIGQTWGGIDGSVQTASTNNLYILNMDMEHVGKVEALAPGETIYSVRFMGDRAYMVTFQKVDPLFVIDTSNPRSPKVLGKLKIPGYSDYLHPFDENHIIGFGKEAVEAKEGNFAWYQGMKLALFDVTDPTNPKELYKEQIGDRGTESPLLHNHKALLFDKERGLLSFPVMVAKIPDDQKRPGNESNAYGSPVFQGAYVYSLTLKDGFSLKGTITHYDNNDAFLKAGGYWYGGQNDVQRIVRIGDSLLTVSNAMVKSHSFPAVKEEGKVELK